MDADEYMDLEDILALRRFIDDTDANMISLQVHECEFATKGSISFIIRTKAFNNRIGIRFFRPINENPELPYGTKKNESSFNLIKIYHWGRTMPKEEMLKKNLTRLEMYAKAAEEHKEDPAFLYLLGMRYKDVDKTDEALRTFDKLVDLCNSNSGLESYWIEGAYTQKAHIKAGNNDRLGCINDSLCAIAINPDCIEAFCEAAAAYLSEKQFDQARELLKKIIDRPKTVHPCLGNADVFWDKIRYVYYANTMLANKEYKESIPYFEKALEYDASDKTLTDMVSLLRQVE